MTFVTDQDRQAIADAIAQVEEKTGGELVTAIAAVSDGYRYIPILFAAVLALLFLPAVYFGQIVVSLQKIMMLQMSLFVLTAILFQVPFVRRFVIPRKVQRQRARRLAYETFFKAGVHRATHRAGILIFVSVEERYVQIIADEGVAAKVDNSVWDAAVATFVSQVRAGRIADGFLQCIGQCGEVLAQHFPPNDDQPVNELANRLIELDGEDL
jgi:putative membrane protein